MEKFSENLQTFFKTSIILRYLRQKRNIFNEQPIFEKKSTIFLQKSLQTATIRKIYKKIRFALV